MHNNLSGLASLVLFLEQVSVSCPIQSLDGKGATRVGQGTDFQHSAVRESNNSVRGRARCKKTGRWLIFSSKRRSVPSVLPLWSLSESEWSLLPASEKVHCGALAQGGEPPRFRRARDL